MGGSHSSIVNRVLRSTSVPIAESLVLPMIRSVITEVAAWLIEQPGLEALLRSVSMKTTARNQFAGTVSALHAGPVTTHVTLALPGGLHITAAMTTVAARELGLRPKLLELAVQVGEVRTVRGAAAGTRRVTRADPSASPS